MKSWPFVLATIMLLSAWGVIQSFSQGELEMAKKSFGDFPLTLDGQWEGKELGLEEKILKVLNLTDYMMRVYVPVHSDQGLETAEFGNKSKTSKLTTSQSASAPVWL